MRLFIYGAGRVGKSIGRAIIDADTDTISIAGAWNRTFKSALATSLVLDTEVSSGDILPDGFSRADVVLLAVVDDAIETMARRLAPHLSPKQILLHTSGSLPSTRMAGEGMRAALGGCHPLQSLPDDKGNPELLDSAVFAIEGAPAALDAARRIVEAIGGEPIAIRPKDKVFYHAAAVVSANYLTVLAHAATLLHAQCGIDTATSVRILQPLLRGTLDNMVNTTQRDPEAGARALAASLTGPVRRGDAGTVKAHLRAIDRVAKKNSDLANLPPLYRALLKQAIALNDHNTPDEDTTASLEELAETP